VNVEVRRGGGRDGDVPKEREKVAVLRGMAVNMDGELEKIVYFYLRISKKVRHGDLERRRT
jgi:hypothetical protein